ncbi:hypothetical protein IPC203_08420 [Pseudomonas aeruginosa]|nr:hypothetical protein IPC203_08420 [Pseudomonas aeruginosa]
MREEFEAWLLREHGLESEWQEERNCFKDYPAHLAFKAWQASRAALRVELPFPIIVDEGAEFALHAYDKDETDKALQQAGIEVK